VNTDTTVNPGVNTDTTVNPGVNTDTTVNPGVNSGAREQHGHHRKPGGELGCSRAPRTPQ
jgi:hypothetical protein